MTILVCKCLIIYKSNYRALSVSHIKEGRGCFYNIFALTFYNIGALVLHNFRVAEQLSKQGTIIVHGNTLGDSLW